MSSHRAFVALACAASLAIASPGCSRRADSAEWRASGHIEATDVRLSTKIGGRLVHFPLREGDSVNPGEELARIDTTDLELILLQAEADGAAAAAELALRLAGARPEDIAETEARLRAVRADLEAARLDLGRAETLLDSGAGTTKARDDARARTEALSSQAEAVAQAAARLRAGSRREEIDAARARSASASARVAIVRQQIADALVLSPLAAVVTQKIAEPGELLPAGAPLAVLTDLTNAWLTVYIGEPDLGRVRIGQPATVVTDGGERRVGTVTFIASRAEFTPRNVQTAEERVKLVYRVKISLDNSDGLFKQGMPGEAILSPSP